MPTVEYSTYAKKSTILALAQRDPDFAGFYLQYQDQIVLPAQSPAVKSCRENAQAAQSFAIPGLPEMGVLIAALFLLRTHIKIHRTKEGKWEFLWEHNASDDGVLEKIAQILAGLFKT